ncbi:MAG TPA: triphosphoribosyl-dephospho-CoA synthase [bacterium]|nr:triphosphoribosyl-dephospho-CoA synthase [bacterium]
MNTLCAPIRGASVPVLFAKRTAERAVRSLLREAEAAPKPGLVDRLGSGSHADMDIGLFRRSATALAPYFQRMVVATSASALRQLGIEAEAAMLQATSGINTHRGAIWTIGLLCAAAGSLRRAATYEVDAPDALALCDEAARIAAAIVALDQPATGAGYGAAKSPTHGQKARADYGLRSARDEALAGFPSIRARALELARSLGSHLMDDDERVIMILLAVMAEADDTCIVARGGMQALLDARSRAAHVLAAGGPSSASGSELYALMRQEFLESRLSPGGSADLCAATLFLVDLESTSCHQHPCPRRLETLGLRS